MKRHARLRFSLIASLCLCATAASAQANPDAVIQNLRSTERAANDQALMALNGVPAEDIVPSVREALARAMAGANASSAQRYRSRRAGNPVSIGSWEGEGRLVLLSVIMRLRDPEMIPALAGALDTGVGVAQALAEFGERAAPDVLRVVMDPESLPRMNSGGLIALRFMLELGQPLSDVTLNAITAAAERHLGATDEGGFSMRRAIDLAAVLSDPQLNEVLRVLASDPAEVAARGVAQEEVVNRIDQLQRAAQEALAGVPPLPRPR